MKKKICILFLAAIFSVIILKTLSNPYTKIARYVNQNEGNLRASCEGYLEQEYVNNVDTEIKVEGIYGGEYTIVQFFYSGKGIVPASVYYGFYYSPVDVPVPYCNGNEELKQVSEDEWTWEDIGDNGGRIRKIRDNWYYYEAWF